MLATSPPRLMRWPGLLAWFIFSLLTPTLAADPAPAVPWNQQGPGQFVLSLCRDLAGNLWDGTEDQGVWRYSLATHTWTQFDARNGLGDSNAYSLACDKQGRVWAGTLNHGVSVFNGKAWRTYDQTNGPLGAHVVALATSPLDGDVWGATEAGLFRYSLSRNIWTYYTRADGLPSDQATALAFAQDGTLYVGTQCDGLAIASPADGYKAWRTVVGRWRIPYTPTGDGLPSNLINALLIGKDGSVYAGTTCGLARSKDSGKTWRYLRGLDWADKARGAVQGLAPEDNAPNGPRLREDYVTALAEDAAGHIWVGHRQVGFDVIDPAQGGHPVPVAADTATKPAAPAPDHLTAFLPLGPTMLAGGYGSGLTQVGSPSVPPAANNLQASTASFPVPALPPSAAELDALTARVQALAQPLAVGSAVFAGQDWSTQGDWVGRYGRQWATLCAARSPLDHNIQEVQPFAVLGQMGPHHPIGDSLRRWVSWVETDNPKSLYDPIPGYRRQSEWDDHGETYDTAKEGPDVWVTVDVPEGTHRVSLYFMNKDGHEGPNRDRDFLIEVKPNAPTITQAEQQPTLARGRVKDFWGGMYAELLVRGPSVYRLRIGRNNSYCTIVSSVMIDRMKGPSGWQDKMPLGWMGGVHYDPPDPDAPVPPDPHALEKILAAMQSGRKPTVPTPAEQERAKHNAAIVASGRALWSALDAAWDKQDGLPVQGQYRLLAYRAIVSTDAPEVLQANWRWALRLWTPGDRDQFKEVMKQAHQTLLDNNPHMQGQQY